MWVLGGELCVMGGEVWVLEGVVWVLRGVFSSDGGSDVSCMVTEVGEKCAHTVSMVICMMFAFMV